MTIAWQTELLDEFVEESSGDVAASTDNATAIGDSDVSYLPRPPAERSQDIGFSDAMFAWSVDDKMINDGAATPSKRKFVLRIDGELIFKRNAINIIIGPTGSGKTSMLMALLSAFFSSTPVYPCISCDIGRRDALHALWSEFMVQPS